MEQPVFGAVSKRQNDKIDYAVTIFQQAINFKRRVLQRVHIGIAAIVLKIGLILTGYVPARALSVNASDTLQLTRISDRIVIDGDTYDSIWDAIAPLPLTSYEPIGGLPPSEPTEVRVAYDDRYIYASVRAYDSDPSGIRINSLYRDKMDGSDFFHILLDTYNDNETAMVFAVNPAGVKFDAIISKDGVPIEGRDPVNVDYDTFWNVATRVDDTGWFAEIRIPFSRLGFQTVNGRVVMGMNVQRVIGRKNERVLFPAVPMNIPNAFYKPTMAQKVSFEGIENRRPLHVTPYVTAGVDQKRILNTEETAYVKDNTYKLDAGFDLRYGISNNFNLDVTVNTDFAQVEADNQQVNLTRFSLFFPEKRQFFQERSSIFEFNTGGSARLFYSRRIGLTEDGDQVKILGGMRLTGRAKSWDIGLLNMQTGKTDTDPSENFGVVRVRRNVFNDYSYAGLMAVSRISTEGKYNIGYGTDGTLRLAKNDYFTWVWAQTLEEETLDASLLDNSRIRLAWFRRIRNGFSWETTYSRTGRNYNPAAGFNTRQNYYFLGQIFRYGWVAKPSSRLLLSTLQVNGSFFRGLTSSKIETATIGTRWEATTKLGHNVYGQFSWQYEDIPAPFTILGHTIIDPGQYEFMHSVLGYKMASSRLVRANFQADVGTFYDGWRITLEASPSWNVSKHLELQLSWLYNLITVPNSDGWFGEHVAQFKLNTAVNTHISTNAFIQMNTSGNIITANIRFRYNFQDGNDLWIVLNEGLNMQLTDFDPHLPRTASQTILVKYTHTFHR